MSHVARPAVAAGVGRSRHRAPRSAGDTRADIFGLRPVWTWVYLAVVVTVWALLRWESDRSAVATLLAFGPRWLWGIPIGVLFRRAPLSAVVSLAVAAGLVVGPIMGLELRGLLPVKELDGQRVRLVTANLGSRLVLPRELVGLVGRTRPDLVLMQECSDRADPAFADLRWNYRDDDALCLASRFPIERTTVRYRPRKPGNDAFVARYRIRLPRETITVVNAHLDTPRDGLATLLSVSPQVGALQAMINGRREQSLDVRRWIAEGDEGTLVVAGDLNLMVDGAIYREAWADLQNAFSAAGVGWGYTKREGKLIGARIDHILVGHRWHVARCWVDEPIGSDHRPLVADLILAN
ncbi:MAG: endonuclease/exonuclease/phosphatase family protein [Vicinamibacterales bacterium]